MLVRTLAAVSWCAVALAVPQAPAHAAAPHAAFAIGVPNTTVMQYVVSEITIVQGDTLTFFNLDYGRDHDLASQDFVNGVRRFESDPVGVGTPAEVRGVSALPPSTYPFVCRAHPEMVGNLTVLPAPAV
ncbi:MAG TPA: plastocyanin/azurin family copper-binding protein [Frankiaceae bacterium]|nr:plastocyanin/azurin family copper-binding protein [Frankiaceae bacterium]